MNYLIRGSAILIIIRLAIISIIIGCIISLPEYFYRLKTKDPQELVPLLIRASSATATILLSITLFEVYLAHFLRKKSFLFIVLFRSVAYSFILSLCLLLMNIVWFIYNGGPVSDQISSYLSGSTYIINLATAHILILASLGFYQINTLHRKWELFNFIIGRYHVPKEVDRIFCFIDLKGSTTIAEKLGHIDFANFLKDYYADITEALRKSNAQIYQYVGDEIILSWSYRSGLKENRMINCFFLMKDLIHQKNEAYIAKYGFYPQFKAGLHGGKVTVTWIGELKKEIVYIGDVLNTTSRIQEDCKRLSKDFLISESLLKKADDLSDINAVFVESTIPRGKERSIRLYSLEHIA